MEDQVPGARQDGASQDTAAQAAADGGEQHPGATIFITQAAAQRDAGLLLASRPLWLPLPSPLTTQESS